LGWPDVTRGGQELAQKPEGDQALKVKGNCGSRDGAHGVQAALGAFEQTVSRGRVHLKRAALQPQHGGDELQVICDSVLQLLEEGRRTVSR
jgi:hypothetical protein